MHLIYAQDRHPTAKLRSAIDILLARFGQDPATGSRDTIIQPSSIARTTR